MNLKEARKKGKTDQFVEEHENDAPADKKRFKKTLEKMEKPTPPEPKQTPEPNEGTSKQGCADC